MHLLTRVAARAVGRAPIARPRPSALFEEPGGAAAPVHEFSDQDMPAPAEGRTAAARLPHRRDGATVAHPPAAHPRAIASPRAPAISQPQPARQAAGHELEAPAASGATARPRPAPALPGDVPGDREASRPGSPQQPAAVAAEGEPGAPRRAPAATRVAALPVPVTRAPEHGHPPAHRRPGQAPAQEPPPVRVHIGRLEVRAEVREPARREAPRLAPEPETLSLSDYLRGKRERV